MQVDVIGQFVAPNRRGLEPKEVFIFNLCHLLTFFFNRVYAVRVEVDVVFVSVARNNCNLTNQSRTKPRPSYVSWSYTCITKLFSKENTNKTFLAVNVPLFVVVPHRNDVHISEIFSSGTLNNKQTNNSFKNHL